MSVWLRRISILDHRSGGAGILDRVCGICGNEAFSIKALGAITGSVHGLFIYGRYPLVFSAKASHQSRLRVFAWSRL
jgi:hypothetical protein